MRVLSKSFVITQGRGCGRSDRLVSPGNRKSSHPAARLPQRTRALVNRRVSHTPQAAATAAGPAYQPVIGTEYSSLQGVQVAGLVPEVFGCHAAGQLTVN